MSTQKEVGLIVEADTWIVGLPVKLVCLHGCWYGLQ
jgi:hypothetical protein